MRINLKLIYLSACFLLALAVKAQVTGTASDGSFPLSGAEITVKGKGTSTVADADGNFNINAEVGDVLIITNPDTGDSFEVNVSSNNLGTIQDSTTVSLAETVVVGSFGRTFESKEIGYGSSNVDGGLIEDQPQPDIARVLQGKAAGVNIGATGGGAGSGTNVIIRGQSSINGNNQALWIVDGVFFNSSTNQQDTFTNGGNVTPSRFLDIDPNNIEDVTVLKGLAATNLYGAAGRNGVILVTTKSGKAGRTRKGFEVNVSQSLFLEDVVLPEYQNVYGGGFQQDFGYFFSNYGPAFADGVDPNNGFWRGTAANGNSLVAHPYDRAALNASFPEFAGATYEYRSYEPVENFFRTGVTSNTSLGFNAGGDFGNIAGSFSYTDTESFLPGNNLQRLTMSLGGSAKLSNKFRFSANMNYSKTDVSTPPIGAGNGSGVIGGNALSIYSDLLYTPRNIDLNNLPFQDPNTGAPVYYRGNNDILNPRWILANSADLNFNNHLWGGANVEYSFTDNITLSYQPSFDGNFERQEFRLNGTAPLNFFGNTLDNGYFREVRSEAFTFNHTLLFNWDIEELFTEKVGVNFTAGGQARRDTYDQTGIEATDQILRDRWTARNFETVSNGGIRAVAGSQDFTSSQNVVGAFAEAIFDFDDYLFLTLSARNDWSSNHESGFNSQFYPSASMAFIATDAFPSLKSNALSYLKLRAGFGTSARFAGPYNTRSTVVQNTAAGGGGIGGSLITQEVNNLIGNRNLRPELQEEIEVGFDLGLFNNRIVLNPSVYRRSITDQILQANVPASSGFGTIFVNAGEVVVEGIEVDLDITPIKGKDFSWTMLNRFTAAETTLEDAGDLFEELAFAGFAGGVGNYAIEGRPLGILQGTQFNRDADGNFIVNGNGVYTATAEIGEIGDPNPDWTLTNINTFNYKNWSLAMQWDYRHGGDILSQTVTSLLQRGLLDETGIDRSQLYVLPGVDSNGNPNNVQITATNLFFNTYSGGANITGAIHESAVYDGSLIRLRNVSLSYSLPKEFLRDLPFGSIQFSLTGDNLWFKALGFPDGANFDPDVNALGVGNGQGIDFLSSLPSRRYGMTVRLTF